MPNLTDVVIEEEAWQTADLPTLAETAARATLRHLDLDPEAHEIAILACDDARIAALNADFRGRPQPTNVLSWPSEDRAADTPGAIPPPPDPDEPELGDIAIAYGTCLREAEAAGLALAAHATHLVVHAALHLLGYDHENDADADLMESTETAILAKLGLHDPYASQPDD